MAICCGNRNDYVIGNSNAGMVKEGGTGNRKAGISRQKDQICKASGIDSLELCDSFGFSVLNGTSLSGKYAEFTFAGPPGASVNDYRLSGPEWSTLKTDFEVKQVPSSYNSPIAATFELMVIDNLGQHM